MDSEEKQKWPVAGMLGLASPVIFTKHAGVFLNMVEEDLQEMLDEVNMVMKKYGFEIDEISNTYYMRDVVEKANVVKSLKKVLND